MNVHLELFESIFKRKIISAKMEKISCPSIIRNLHAATAMQFRLSATDNGVHARSRSGKEP